MKTEPEPTTTSRKTNKPLVVASTLLVLCVPLFVVHMDGIKTQEEWLYRSTIVGCEDDDVETECPPGYLEYDGRTPWQKLASGLVFIFGSTALVLSLYHLYRIWKEN